MKEAATKKEIILEEKIHITETEEIIEAEIPDTNEKLSINGKEIAILLWSLKFECF